MIAPRYLQSLALNVEPQSCFHHTFEAHKMDCQALHGRFGEFRDRAAMPFELVYALEGVRVTRLRPVSTLTTNAATSSWSCSFAYS